MAVWPVELSLEDAGRGCRDECAHGAAVGIDQAKAVIADEAHLPAIGGEGDFGELIFAGNQRSWLMHLQLYPGEGLFADQQKSRVIRRPGKIAQEIGVGGIVVLGPARLDYDGAAQSGGNL